MVGWLPRFWAQTESAAILDLCDVYQAFRVIRLALWMQVLAVSRLHIAQACICLTTEGITKTSVSVTQWLSAFQR